MLQAKHVQGVPDQNPLKPGPYALEDKMLKVYHDTGAISREYTCERIEYKGTYVLLHNVCGYTVARTVCLSPARGDIRVEAMVRKLKVA